MFIWKISSDILKGKTAHVLFSVQKEMQRGVLTALPAGGSPAEITTFKCLFFPLKRKSASTKGETSVGVCS